MLLNMASNFDCNSKSNDSLILKEYVYYLSSFTQTLDDKENL